MVPQVLVVPENSTPSSQTAPHLSLSIQGPSADVEPDHPTARQKEMCLPLVVNTSLNPGCCFAGLICKNYHCLCRTDSFSVTVF